MTSLDAIRGFEHPEFTVATGGNHVHGFLMNATIAEGFTRLSVFFPVDPPAVESQRFRLRDSSGRVYAGVAGEDLGDLGATFHNWTFPRLVDGVESFSVEFSLGGAPYEVINGMVL